MLKPRFLPDAERVSVLAAIILLAYALARIVYLPERGVEIPLPGIILSFQFSIRTVVSLLVAGITAAGADWLLRDHPKFQDKVALQHALLPALTAWVIGIPLYQLSYGLFWWLGSAVGAGLLVLVLVAEYIVVDAGDVRQSLAAAGLTAVSFALFLILAIGLRASEVRLFLLIPALSLAAWLVSVRTLHLRLHGKWAFMPSALIALITGQVVAAFHYWPITPITFGVAVLGPAYALCSLVGGLLEGEPLRRAVVGPALVMSLVWGAALWI